MYLPMSSAAFMHCAVHQLLSIGCYEINIMFTYACTYIGKERGFVVGNGGQAKAGSVETKKLSCRV
jgi:hypothetical protein